MHSFALRPFLRVNFAPISISIRYQSIWEASLRPPIYFSFFFSFCRKWIFGRFSSIREIFLFSFIEDSLNFISHVEILIRQIRISRKLIKRSVSVSCQGVCFLKNYSISITSFLLSFVSLQFLSN